MKYEVNDRANHTFYERCLYIQSFGMISVYTDLPMCFISTFIINNEYQSDCESEKSNNTPQQHTQTSQFISKDEYLQNLMI